uniref:Retrovirus-related Pol polyprotein from transposon TNT 1-94-like beta-barrel domain-containing protein n=1 Tax=Cajanus cajan TaxID=3821 RepID=A0A151RBS9_CAJCA|nr:hypothetical protein KK1_038609 [Cajanus cajan]
MTSQVGNLKNLKPYFGSDTIFVGNGQTLSITNKDKALLKTTQGKLHLNNILVVPKLKKNLLSISQLINDNDCFFEFNSYDFLIKD